MISVRTKILWAVVAVVAAFLGAWLARELHRSEPQLASGTWFPQPREIDSFSLMTDMHGPLTPASLRGHPTLVFFGFTHCPDVCPTTLATLAQVKKAARIDDLRVVLISVDPGRDTPQLLGKYARAFDPTFVGAAGSQAETQRVARAFGVAMQRADLPGGDYTVDHSAAIFLLDADARIVAVFTPPLDQSAMAEDLRRSSASIAAP